MINGPHIFDPEHVERPARLSPTARQLPAEAKTLLDEFILAATSTGITISYADQDELIQKINIRLKNPEKGVNIVNTRISIIWREFDRLLQRLDAARRETNAIAEAV